MSCRILRNAIKAIIYFIFCKSAPFRSKEKGKKNVYKSVSPSVPREKERNCSFHTLAQKCCSVWVHIYAPGEGEGGDDKAVQSNNKGLSSPLFPSFCVCPEKFPFSPPPDTQIYGLLKRASSPPPFPPNPTSDKKYLFSVEYFILRVTLSLLSAKVEGSPGDRYRLSLLLFLPRLRRV